MDDAVLRLLRFRPEGPGSVLDATLRDELPSRLAGMAGLCHAFVGRHGPDEAGERLIVSVWAAESAMAAALESAGLPGGLEVAGAILDPVAEVLPIGVALPDLGEGSPGILRVFRGETRPGMRDEYLAAVRAGTLEDVAGGTGPLALFLGLDGEHGFVTVSVWKDWEDVAAATGANVRQPVATRHASRLVGGTAAHYEVIPGAVPEPARLATPS